VETILGGSGDDIGRAIAVVAGGDVYVTGPTSSRDFPKTAPLQFEFAGSESAFVAKISDSVEALADLTLRLAASPDPVVTGHDVTFTMIVTNDGPEVASEVTLINTLPDPSYQVSFVSATTSQGSCARAEQLVICSLGSLLVDTSAIVEVVLRPMDLFPFPYSASIFSDIADPDVTNNIATAQISVNGNCSGTGSARLTGGLRLLFRLLPGANVRVRLSGGPDGCLEETETNMRGDYQFEDLALGIYTVTPGNAEFFGLFECIWVPAQRTVPVLMDVVRAKGFLCFPG
jgi:uncharacterized repeat protein (TIGR01451 family)